MSPVLLFDLFGVIARKQSQEACGRIEEAAGVGPAFWSAYWDLRGSYDRGVQSGPDYWRAVARRLGTTFGHQQICDLLAADLDSWSEVDCDMVALIEELHAGGTRMGLLSNIPEELANRYEARHPWLECFEIRAFSCRITHVKPERGAYLWCVQALKVIPAEIMFIDDRIDNVTAATALGMRGHLYTSVASLRRALCAARLSGVRPPHSPHQGQSRDPHPRRSP
jgi:putative hydrolase of the HAD superfamily